MNAVRKVNAVLFSSIDNVVQAPNEWQPSFDAEMAEALDRSIADQDAVLLGRTTYDEWKHHWPTSTDEPYANWINKTPKYVASTTKESVDEWQNTSLIEGPVADFVRDLRETEGGTIGVAGSPTLVRALVEEGLLDGLCLMISPVVAGGGRRRLFPEGAGLARFRLAEARTSSTGVIIATYCADRAA
jgi:dihydrofolate reductase